MYDAIKQYNTPLCLSIYWLCVKNLLVRGTLDTITATNFTCTYFIYYLYTKKTNRKLLCRRQIQSRCHIFGRFNYGKKIRPFTIYNALFFPQDASPKHGEFYAIHVLFIIRVLYGDFYRIIVYGGSCEIDCLCNFMRFCASRIVIRINMLYIRVLERRIFETFLGHRNNKSFLYRDWFLSRKRKA